MVFKYVKRRILFFLVVCLICFPICLTKQKPVAEAEESSTSASDNAYLACFIDDSSCMYKTQVIYSGSYIEAYRVSRLLQLDNKDNKGVLESASVDNYVWGTQSSLFLDEPNERIAVRGFRNYIDGDNSVAPPSFRRKTDNTYGVSVYMEINNNNGQFALTASQSELNIPLSEIMWSENAKYMPRPLSFPSSQRGATEADINRAYEVQSILSDDFRDALLFLNDSQAYTNVDTLIETAYSLVIASDEGTITNQFGTKYIVDFGDGNGGYVDEDSNGYLYYVLISKVEGGKKVNTTRFNFKVKKGYVNCNFGEPMENGAKNSLDGSLYTEATDTTYISWEQLFVEAGILYAQGISYANQGDLFNIDSLQSSLVTVLRDTFISIKGFLELYSMEDCVFNSGIRGSEAFVHGVYYSNWSYYVSLFFMIFVAIAMSLILISLIRIIINKQLGAISPSARYSMAEGIKNLIIALFVMSSIWLITKFILLLNGRYVDIWGNYIFGRTLTDTSVGYSTLSAILYQITYFIIVIYVNYVYILRSVVVPALLVSSPLFIIAYAFGEGGKRLTIQWIKEFLGNIFLQSIHATVYGIILVMSTSLRGIEGIVLCSAFIPMTSIYRSILQIGGDEILKKAQGLTATTTAGIGAGVSVATGAVSGIASGIGTAIGNPALGSMVSDIANGANGLANAGLGAGLSVTTGDHQGFQMMSSGARTLGSSLSSLGSNTGRTIYSRRENFRTNGGNMDSSGINGRSSSSFGGNSVGVGASRGSFRSSTDNLSPISNENALSLLRSNGYNDISNIESAYMNKAGDSMVVSARCTRPFGEIDKDSSQTTAEIKQNRYIRDTFNAFRDAKSLDMESGTTSNTIDVSSRTRLTDVSGDNETGSYTITFPISAIKNAPTHNPTGEEGGWAKQFTEQ